MSFVSLSFLITFIILLTILAFTKNRISKKLFVLGYCYFFYITWSKKLFAILIIISLLAYLFGYLIKNTDKVRVKKLLLSIGCVTVLLPLVYFKYCNFFIESFSSIFNWNFNVLKILLPIGISFYSFQAISYIADIYLKKVDNNSLLDVLLYVSFFPQILAGPIVKSRDFFSQIKSCFVIKKENLNYGVQKIALGIFKKYVVADRIGVSVDSIYGSFYAYSGMSLVLNIFAYSLQIYYDFSGYSDIAIGIARILGFDFGQNFNLPYLAKNTSEFWKRWHISLSSWFKEYVYIPLGGNRKGKIRTYINILITMILSGLWHGAGLNYIIWGALHGIGSIIDKVFNYTNKSKQRNTSIIRVMVNFIFVSMLWVPFRIANISDVITIFSKVLTLSNGINYINIYVIIFIVMTFVIEIIAVKKNNCNDFWKPLDLSKFSSKIAFAIFILIIILFSYIGNGAFIYAQF